MAWNRGKIGQMIISEKRCDCIADNEIKRRLAGRAAEYMMFKDDEEDTEVPADISSSDSVIDFSNLEESKNKIQSDK